MTSRVVVVEREGGRRRDERTRVSFRKREAVQDVSAV